MGWRLVVRDARVNMSVLGNRTNYKPFLYPFAFEGYTKQKQMHWIPEEVQLREDIQDWNKKLTKEEKNLLTQLFRFFTTADVDVAKGYIQKFMPWFGGHPELAMMMSTFASLEAIHVEAYSLLLDTVGMPELEYSAFDKYKEMAAKHDYVANLTDTDTVQGKAKALAIYSAFTEGMQLFSSFAILLNFTRFGKMKGMGKIVTFSIKDESLHCEYMIKLFRQLIQENIHVWTDEFKKELYDVAREMVKLEDAFIDLVFEQDGVEGITSDEVKQYIRYIADRRLLQLGLKTEFKVKKNPLHWLDEMLNAPEHASFFETRVSEYQKGALKGDWSNVFKTKKGSA